MAVKVYVVGGFVRDAVLSRCGIRTSPSDRDFVVVGATPQLMVEKGFIPVGADFPVFLHPETHEEYALARTERKTSHGYKGFSFSASPDVTLEEDLSRRDLTMNAIAMDEDGTLIDPFGGEEDIRKGVFRHVGPAFSEDPVRILRLARFAAKLPSFSVDTGTWSLVCGMVASGEADYLVAERVTKEISRGLMEAKPSRMTDMLCESGAWERIAGTCAPRERVAEVIESAASAKASLQVRLAAFFIAASGSGGAALSRRLRAGGAVSELVETCLAAIPMMREADSPEKVVAVLERADAFRRRERFLDALSVRLALTGEGKGFWPEAADAASGVNSGALARSAPSRREIPLLIRAARTAAVAEIIAAGKSKGAERK